jgi:hypothetical protein
MKQKTVNNISIIMFMLFSGLLGFIAFKTIDSYKWWRYLSIIRDVLIVLVLFGVLMPYKKIKKGAE